MEENAGIFGVLLVRHISEKQYYQSKWYHMLCIRSTHIVVRAWIWNIMYFIQQIMHNSNFMNYMHKPSLPWVPPYLLSIARFFKSILNNPILIFYYIKLHHNRIIIPRRKQIETPSINPLHFKQYTSDHFWPLLAWIIIISVGGV